MSGYKRKRINDEYIPLKKRKKAFYDEINSSSKSIKSAIKEENERRLKQKLIKMSNGRDMRSLIDINYDLINKGNDPNDKNSIEQENELLKGIDKTQKLLISANDYAKGIKYIEPIKTTWNPPKKYINKGIQWSLKQRMKYNIEISVGDNDKIEDVPPPIKKFKDMKFPECILKGLMLKNIKKPTPIQMQGFPCVLSGRDTIGIAYTGSGKTLVFAIPMILFCMEEELKMKIINGEGPFGIIICPSRELATQTYNNIIHFTNIIKDKPYNICELRTLLCIGGINFKTQSNILYNGIHMIVGTPGRIKDCLEKKKFNFKLLKYFCLDEADRLMDIGFDDDIRDILSFIDKKIQKIFFSATMPKKVKDLAIKSMIKPIIINIGRAGAANLDVIQEVEYVKDEAKILYLLECLKKTGPPVLIFCSNQSDVDDIYEYLLIKGINACSIHGKKNQADRQSAINLFKNNKKDVLIATDVASKGLDFPDIKHVINFDMPKEIEDYIHRIGRTGRCGKTGVATTFINANVPDITKYDLKGLLMESNQRIPPILQEIAPDFTNTNGLVGCAYCAGLGHRVINCPKLAASRKGKNKGFVDESMLMSNY